MTLEEQKAAFDAGNKAAEKYKTRSESAQANGFTDQAREMLTASEAVALVTMEIVAAILGAKNDSH